MKKSGPEPMVQGRPGGEINCGWRLTAWRANAYEIGVWQECRPYFN